MTYKVGDTVVYPRHGAARVEEISERTLRGVTRKYLKLSILSSDGLVINVPAENLDKVGVRDIVDAKAVTKVFEILRTPIEEEKTNWSRRYKLNVEKIATGDVNKIAEVVRDLAQRDDEEHGLSAGEKRMLTKARNILASEIALSEHLEEDMAQHLLDVNLGYVEPTKDDIKHHSKSPAEPASETLNRLAEEEEQAAGKAKKGSKESKSKKK
ncbi:MAG: CarD family transcriptional regulator [Bifidobacteriaceae bacterium]|jgi:CarD family transcriptional regulator|nr:CarD family transcriptional regulator [Bifidobacteriaceae bacterium]MCI1914540.1 CarD family transcriptional regulator [Bifidobacteriaceae bacterium]